VAFSRIIGTRIPGKSSRQRGFFCLKKERCGCQTRHFSGWRTGKVNGSHADIHSGKYEKTFSYAPEAVKTTLRHANAARAVPRFFMVHLWRPSRYGAKYVKMMRMAWLTKKSSHRATVKHTDQSPGG
jgi:hypothetical protein